MDSFNKLCFLLRFLMNRQSYTVIAGLCKQYCDEHWHDEWLNWNVSSTDDLFGIFESSSYHNPFNLGLLKFVANKYREVDLIDSVKNYEKEFSYKEIKDIDFVREIEVVGNISKIESTLVINTLLENKVTIGQLWKFCSPRLINDDTLILDASESLLEFYYSVKVCMQFTKIEMAYS